MTFSRKQDIKQELYTIPLVSAEPRLTINYKAIQNRGLNANEGLLARADKIIR